MEFCQYPYIQSLGRVAEIAYIVQRIRNFPKAIIENEDTLQAKSVDYSPGEQFRNRLDKISDSKVPSDLPFEVIVLGGSFSSLPMEYRTEFVTQLYEEMNQVNECQPNSVDGTEAKKM